MHTHTHICARARAHTHMYAYACLTTSLLVADFRSIVMDCPDYAKQLEENSSMMGTGLCSNDSDASAGINTQHVAFTARTEDQGGDKTFSRASSSMQKKSTYRRSSTTAIPEQVKAMSLHPCKGMLPSCIWEAYSGKHFHATQNFFEKERRLEIKKTQHDLDLDRVTAVWLHLTGILKSRCFIIGWI